MKARSVSLIKWPHRTGVGQSTLAIARSSREKSEKLLSLLKDAQSPPATQLNRETLMPFCVSASSCVDTIPGWPSARQPSYSSVTRVRPPWSDASWQGSSPRAEGSSNVTAVFPSIVADLRRCSFCCATSDLVQVNVSDLPAVHRSLTDNSARHRRSSAKRGMSR